MADIIYDVCIIGGGPAGVAAGVYAARKKMRSALIAESFGGQSIVSAEIQNWIGDTAVSGYDLARRLEAHLRAQAAITILVGDRAQGVERSAEELEARGPEVRRGIPRGAEGFSLTLRSGAALSTRTIIVASGSRRRRLGIPGEDQFDGKGIAFCGTCDAPLFAGKAVAVVGGGNSGLETVRDLLPYASKVFLLHRGSALKGDAVTQEKIIAHPSVQVLLDSTPTAVIGDRFVNGLRYRRTDGSETTLNVGGVFVEIGSVPNSEFVAPLVTRNSWGEIVVDQRTQRTSAPGIWAAGDVTNGLYRQNNVSVGEGITALLNVHDYLHGVSRS